MGYGLDGPGIGVRFPAGSSDLSLLHCVQTGCGSHMSFSLEGTSGYFPGVKRRGHDANSYLYLVPRSTSYGSVKAFLYT
jgi:hypothetical protein